MLALGINGIQWLDGSFFEDIEQTQRRSPNDIDVVTFFTRPPHLLSASEWAAFVQANLEVFDPSMAKAQFRTDPYFVDVSIGPLFVIEQASYWYGLFSHQRVTSLWKGMVKVWLDQQRDDLNAIHLLSVK